MLVLYACSLERNVRYVLVQVEAGSDRRDLRAQHRVVHLLYHRVIGCSAALRRRPFLVLVELGGELAEVFFELLVLLFEALHRLSGVLRLLVGVRQVAVGSHRGVFLAVKILFVAELLLDHSPLFFLVVSLPHLLRRGELLLQLPAVVTKVCCKILLSFALNIVLKVAGDFSL